MKDKILFWIDAGLAHFGIAKFVQEKYDCDLYAIYDLNHHLKKSFINQKIVNFKKEWYFWDHISKATESPELRYLETFEDKYKINLWVIAYSERLFSNYNQFYRFGKNEILSILEQECKFFESVLDEIKPDFLVIKLTDFHRNHLLSEICKLRGIKVLMLIPTKFGYRASIASELNKIDDLWDVDVFGNENRSLSDLQKYIKKYDRFQQTTKIKSGGLSLPIWKKIEPSLKFLTKTFDKEYRSSYDHYGMTRLRVIVKRTFSYLKRRYREYFIDRNFVRELNKDEKFVFFPLQVEPERNVSIDAPFYSNQLEVITSITKALPVEYKLYVKEHYNMKFRDWRDISYYKTILSLPNVRLIHHSVNPQEIMNKCSLVITITGTSGLEAAFYKKPSIVFADVIFSELPSVHRLKSLEELPQAIRASLQKEVNLSDLNKFVSITDKNSFEFDVFGFHNEILRRFHHEGFLISDEISINDLNSFVEENRNKFELLAVEHIKKINQSKKSES